MNGHQIFRWAFWNYLLPFNWLLRCLSMNIFKLGWERIEKNALTVSSFSANYLLKYFIKDMYKVFMDLEEQFDRHAIAKVSTISYFFLPTNRETLLRRILRPSNWSWNPELFSTKWINLLFERKNTCSILPQKPCNAVIPFSILQGSLLTVKAPYNELIEGSVVELFIPSSCYKMLKAVILAS